MRKPHENSGLSDVMPVDAISKAKTVEPHQSTRRPDGHIDKVAKNIAVVFDLFLAGL